MKFLVPLTLVFIVLGILYFLYMWIVFDFGFQNMAYHESVEERIYYDDPNYFYYVNGLD